MERNSYFYALSSHPNIEIKIYNKINLLLPWKTQGRMHDKYVIADDYGYILGGRNTFDYFIGSYPTNSRSHDREVLVYNTAHGTAGTSQSSLNQVEAYFNQVWNLNVSSLFHDDETLAEKDSVKKAAGVLRDRYNMLANKNPELLGWEMENPGQPACPALPIDPDINDNDREIPASTQPAPLAYYEEQTVPAGKITLVSNPTDIYAKEPVVFYTMTELMRSAREQVVIHTPYAVFNNYMYDTLTEVTSHVPVTMMINSVENGDNFFASSDYPRHKKAFIGTGMEILEYDGGLSYHGKSLLIDHELCAVGSYNFDLRSTYMAGHPKS